MLDGIGVVMGRSSGIRLDGATVVVTGGARGIGEATARLFASQGARVWIGDIDADVAERAASGIRGARSALLDVTDRASWAQFVKEVTAEGDVIDILVNNAGVMPLDALDAESPELIDLTMDVNVHGMLNGMRAVVPAMVESGRGHVVNVASMAGLIPIPGMVVYNASKFAALGASRAARLEYAGTGVTVSAILPSAVRTELSSGAPLGGGMPTVDPEDVARAIVHTCRTRAAVTSVPRWVGRFWRISDALTPEWLEVLARKLLRDRRALTSIDADRRRAYTDRLDRHAGMAR